MREKPNSLKSIIFTGLFAAIIYLGIFILRIPIPAMVGRPFIHFGNTLAALAVLFLGFRNGTLAGIIGLGGFDILNGYAATSWLTMLEVIIVASIIELLFRFFKYQDKQKQIAIIALAAGIAKIFTSYCTSIIEALMIGTNFKDSNCCFIFKPTCNCHQFYFNGYLCSNSLLFNKKDLAY
jgi:uncharacterized membrane protein